ELLHDRRPVDAAVEQGDEPVNRAEVVAGAALEILDVDADDLLAQQADPLLGEAEDDDVADVEPDADRRAVDLVEEAAELQRAHEELVPDVLQPDAQVSGRGPVLEGGEAVRGELPAVVVGDLGGELAGVD